MFCPNCGNKLNDVAKFCNMCGTPIASSAPDTQEPQAFSEPVVDTVSGEPAFGGPVQEPQAFSESAQEDFSGRKPRKWKKWVILGGSVAAACIAVAITFVVAGAQIRNFFNAMKSPEEYYRIVENDNIENYDRLMLNAAKTGSMSTKGNMSRSVDAKLEINPTVLSMLSQFTNRSDIDFSKLSNIEYHGTVGIKDSKEFANVGEIQISGEKLIDFTTFMSVDSGETFFSIPTLSDAFVKFQSDLLSNSRLSALAGGMSNNYSELLKAIPDADALEKLMDRYIDIILDGINHVSKQDGTLDVGGVSEDCTILQVSLTRDDLRNILNRIVEEMKNDADLRAIISSVDSSINYDDMIREIGSFVDMYIPAGSDEAMSMSLYVNSKGDVIGRRIRIPYGYQTAELFMGLPTAGGQFAFTVQAGTDGDMTEYASGFGTSKGGVITGDITVGDSEQKTVIHVADFDLSALKDGKVKGSFTISMPSGTMVGGAQLKIDVDTDMTKGEFKMNLLFAGQSMGSLSINVGEASFPDAAPSGSDKVYEGSDPNQIAEYINSLDLSGFAARIKDTIGIDISSYIDQFRQYIPMINNQYDY